MNVLMIMAHPDDEVIFGWPVLQNDSFRKTVLFCSTDLNNPSRAWCAHRSECAKRFLNSLSVDVVCLDYPSEFYKMDVRKGGLARFCDDVLASIDNLDFDVIFTHNPIGEYGHLDHILVHSVVSGLGVRTWTTDIVVQSDWIQMRNLSSVRRRFPGQPIEDCVCDEDFYGRCKAEYKSKGAWTWNKDMVSRCKLLEKV